MLRSVPRLFRDLGFRAVNETTVRNQTSKGLGFLNFQFSFEQFSLVQFSFEQFSFEQFSLEIHNSAGQDLEGFRV